MPKPYTIKFGPWAPDLQDVGIEMPFQWSDTQLPVADCENVYWQDAAYRCLPAPAPTGPSLGTPILDCFTWYDNSEQKEVLFAATANGLSALIDGAWSALSIETEEGATGLSISMALGAAQGLATSIAPASQSDSGTSTSYVFSAVTFTIGAGEASSYTWSFNGLTGSGGWTVISGQGTETATAEVTDATSGQTSTANMQCSAVVNGITYTLSVPLSYECEAFSPVLHSYTSGSGSDVIPTGASQVVIEVTGPGGIGAGGTYPTKPYESGGGGGGGGYAKSTYPITSAEWGKSIAYVVGTSATVTASSVSSGSFSVSSMTANPGNSGTFGTSGTPGSQGTGGSASGGNDANDSGGGGGGVTSAGASPTPGEYFNTGPTYGIGGRGTIDGTTVPGTNGAVSLYYS